MISVIILAAIHFISKSSGWIWRGNFLSVAAGISFAYVFVDLLPALEKGQQVLKRTFDHILPYIDRHTYVIALLGVVFYYGLHSSGKKDSWMGFFGYMIFNFFVGAGLAESDNPEVRPIILFTVAMGMHYFVQDHNIDIYYGRWYLVAALFLGYFVESFTHVPEPIIAIAVSFMAGGMMFNAFRYELPKRDRLSYPFFLGGALGYTALLLSIGK